MRNYWLDQITPRMFRFKHDYDFIDLSTVAQHNSRYQEYERLYNNTEIREKYESQWQLVTFSTVKSGGEPIKDSYIPDLGMAQKMPN